MKENKYDDDRFFEQYSQMSRSTDGLAGAGEWHALRQLLPSMEDKSVLDLGCGYGWHCRYAVEHGAGHVVGIDISQKMIAKARQINADPRIEYHVTALEDFDFEAARFDVVLSSLAFHYIESFDAICRNVHTCLKAGGDFIFSVEHPIFTAQGSQQWHLDQNGHPLHWPVDHYFTEGLRHTVFLGESVQKYHRTLTTYLNTLLCNGFEIQHLIEPTPEQALIDQVAGMADELRRPMMLIIAARKKRL